MSDWLPAKLAPGRWETVQTKSREDTACYPGFHYQAGLSIRPMRLLAQIDRERPLSVTCSPSRRLRPFRRN